MRLDEMPSVTLPGVETKWRRLRRWRGVRLGRSLLGSVDRWLAGLEFDEGRSLARSHPETWGWLPALTLTGALGLLVIAIGDVAAENAQGWAEPLFWMGLLTLYLPVTLRLVSPAVGRREGLGLVLVLGLGLYLVKVMHSPVVFSFPDEFSHWRTADEIGQTGRLFGENPLLPVSPLYPGQEIITAALCSLSGMSIFQAGVLIVGAARILLVVSLYAIFNLISRSPRIAGIATAIYLANPNYLFFSAGFDYESVAVPAAALVVLALLYRQNATGTARTRLSVVALMILGLVITTHHLTSYALSGFLVAWLVSARLRRQGKQQGPGLIAVIAPIASLLWLDAVGSTVVSYVAPHVLATAGELWRLVAGESGAGRQIFQSTTGYVAPLWERLTGIAAVGLILAGLPLGIVLVWRRYRDRAVVLVLALVALAYPPSLMLRLTGRGWEIGNRSSEFVFFGIAFVLALTAAALVRGRQSRDWALPVAACITVVFIGGVIAGWTPAWRLPASHAQGAELSRDDPEAIAAAVWSRTALGPNRHVAAQAIPMMLMGSYGRQNIETSLSGGVDAGWTILAPRVDAEQIRQLRKGQVEYIVIDRRLGNSDPSGSALYPGVRSDEALAKFDRLQAVSRIFDSGNVQIFDVRRLRDTGNLSSAQ